MLLQNSNAISSDGYVIDNSLRFSQTSLQRLSKTFSSSNRKIWTTSMWVKRGSFNSNDMGLFGVQANIATHPLFRICFQADTTLKIVETNGSGTPFYNLVTQRLFRDCSSFYHILISFDSTNAVSSERVKIYVNGELQTSLSANTQPTLNFDSAVNTAVQHHIGNLANNSTTANEYFDGYMTETHFIDGQALTPSSFGEINQTTGQWVAKKYTGTYGTNGFYLDFKNGTSTTTLGHDKSGNTNNWTLTNFTRSAGVNDCWMLDEPAGNGSASAVQPSGNYCVWNPLALGVGTLSKGNLSIQANTPADRCSRGTIAVSSGKWFWEATITQLNNLTLIGLLSISSTASGGLQSTGNGVFYVNDGSKQLNSGSLTAYGATYTTNDVVRVELDLDNLTVTFFKNNVSQGSVAINADTYLPAYIPNGNTSSVTDFNFGQRVSAHTPTAGFKALCTSNLPNPAISKPEKHFDTILWTGNDSTTRAIAGLNFSPDFTWIKCRSKNYDHLLVDSLRGSTNSLISNSTGAEVANNITGYVSSLDSNGFTVSFGTTNGQVVNEVSQNYVAWNWRASDSTPTTNTDGSITSTVSANPTAGFSIVTYTGTGVNATVGHGLGKIPALIIVKNATSGVSYWCVQHKSLPVPSVLRLNETTASASGANIWTSNNNTSLIFNVGGANETNRPSNTMVAYCFAEIDGYSKFGSYTGNGSADGAFIYLGFRPKFLLLKCTDTAGRSWPIFDGSRTGYNPDNNEIFADLANAENTADMIDFLSNGFKFRSSDTFINASGSNYIFLAFAETPFQYSNAR